jgi:hypothetical protein
MQENYGEVRAEEMREAFKKQFGEGPSLDDAFAKLFLTDADDITEEKVITALENPDVKSVAFHKPGEVVTLLDGTRYEVRENGSWKKL